jgi:hypothetical protein
MACTRTVRGFTVYENATYYNCCYDMQMMKAQANENATKTPLPIAVAACKRRKHKPKRMQLERHYLLLLWHAKDAKDESMDPLMLISLRSAMKRSIQLMAFDQAFSSYFSSDQDGVAQKKIDITTKNSTTMIHPFNLIYAFASASGSSDEAIFLDIAAMAAAVLSHKFCGDLLHSAATSQLAVTGQAAIT